MSERQVESNIRPLIGAYRLLEDLAVQTRVLERSWKQEDPAT